MMRCRRTVAFSLMELLIVVVAAAAALAIIFPIFQAQRQQRLVELMRFQYKELDAWLTAYYYRYGDYPRPSDTGVNSYNESMVSALRGAKVLNEGELAGWLGDTDGDKVPEMVDPWGNPWIYFHPGTYTAEPPQYRIGKRAAIVRSAKTGDTFYQPSRYQIWACGPNETNESGLGDDCGNIN